VLAEYSTGVEGTLRSLELESIQDYITESDNLVGLHTQVRRVCARACSCAAVCTRACRPHHTATHTPARRTTPTLMHTPRRRTHTHARTDPGV
jgi:hypothetical protein